jgi:hypothetical protein
MGLDLDVHAADWVFVDAAAEGRHEFLADRTRHGITTPDRRSGVMAACLATSAPKKRCARAMARRWECHVPFAAAGRGLGVLPGLARVEIAGSLPCGG